MRRHRGQYGYVYEGYHLKTKTPVAIKRVDRQRSKPEYIALEIAVLRLSNDSRDVVDLLDVFETESYVYLVMEMYVLGSVAHVCCTPRAAAVGWTWLFFDMLRHRVSGTAVLTAPPSPAAGCCHDPQDARGRDVRSAC